MSKIRRYTKIVALLLLGASGLTIALSEIVDLPGWILGVAFVVAFIGTAVVVSMSWSEARRSGFSNTASSGRGVRTLGQFIRDFF